MDYDNIIASMLASTSEVSSETIVTRNGVAPVKLVESNAVDIDSILASMQASSGSDEPETVVIRNHVRTGKKSKKESAPKAEVVKARTGEAIFGLALPEKRPFDEGTSTPSFTSSKLFMEEMLRAGRRYSTEGSSFTDKNEIRNDSIKAIAAYIGYNVSESFATQEQAARSLASRILSGKKLAGETRADIREKYNSALESGKAVITTAGYADHVGKRIANLQAQDREVCDIICQATTDSEDKRKTFGERVQASNILAVNREKLIQIRKDLSNMKAGAIFVHPHAEEIVERGNKKVIIAV